MFRPLGTLGLEVAEDRRGEIADRSEGRQFRTPLLRLAPRGERRFDPLQLAIPSLAGVAVIADALGQGLMLGDLLLKPGIVPRREPSGVVVLLGLHDVAAE